MNYVTGKTIKVLREKKKLTQKQLAEMMHISDKTISKWETNRGLPDMSLIEPLANALDVSIEELLTGKFLTNQNRSANMLKMKFYVCPVCGNVIQSIGESLHTCCGITLPVLQEEDDVSHQIQIDTIQHEYYVSLDHSMTKKHYISFIAYVTNDQIQFKKLYPEQNCECYFTRKGRGFLYAYCQKDGLYKIKV